MEPVYQPVDRYHLCPSNAPDDFFPLGLIHGPDSFSPRGLDPSVVTVKFYSLVVAQIKSHFLAPILVSVSWTGTRTTTRTKTGSAHLYF